MSKRNLIIATIVLVLLAVVSQWFGRSENNARDDNIGNSLLAAKQVEAFDELVLQNSEGKLTIQKQGEEWLVAEKQGYPANMEKLLELIDQLTGTTIASLITKDERRQNHFQVVYWDDQKANAANAGTQLTLNNQGQTVFTMMAGKKRLSKPTRPDMPPQPDGVYVRVGKNPAVYLIKENLDLETDSSAWIQTSLFKLDKKEIRSILFELSNDRIKLERPDKGKEMVLSDLKKGEKMADYELSSTLSNLEDFEIDQIVSRQVIQESNLALKSVITVAMYDAPDLIFRLYGKTTADKKSPDQGNESYFVRFMEPEKVGSDGRWEKVHKLSDSWMFELEEWKAKRWIKSRQDFIEKEEN